MNERTRRVWIGVWIALATFVVLRTGGRDRGVITDHLEFGRRLFAGEALYAPFEDDGPLHSVYPPSFGLMTAPFTLLPERAARYGWGGLQILALWSIALSMLAMLRRFRPDLWDRRHALLALMFVIGARYVLRDTHGGGGNSINLALALGAFRLAEAHRTGLAALVLGLSLATKPTTAALVPVLVVMGHGTAALGSLVAAALIAAVAVLVHGHGLDAFRHWAEGALAYGAQQDLFATPLHDLPRFTWMNQSLRCAVGRYLGSVPVDYAAEVPGFAPGLGWPAATTAMIARALGLVVAGATLAQTWRRRGSASGRFCVVGAALAAGLLLSPISWKAHHTALLPAFFVLAIAALDNARGARALAGAYFVLCVAGGGDIVGSTVKEWQQSLYLATFGTIALWLWMMRTRVLAPGDDPGR